MGPNPAKFFPGNAGAQVEAIAVPAHLTLKLCLAQGLLGSEMLLGSGDGGIDLIKAYMSTSSWSDIWVPYEGIVRLGRRHILHKNLQRKGGLGQASPGSAFI